MKKLIAGNWKMNLGLDEARNLAGRISQGLNTRITENAELLLCPAFVHIPAVKELFSTIGGQDCAAGDNGAHTGDISARMLKDIGCSYVILGHSERRAGHHESPEDLEGKIQQALFRDLNVIYCVGENLGQRQNGKHEDIVSEQLSVLNKFSAQGLFLTIAYEPVWAIGSGESASPADIQAMHSHIREKLKESLEYGDQIRILYGGSVKPSNARDIFTLEDVNGALIGGASLKADDFLAIAEHSAA